LEPNNKATLPQLLYDWKYKWIVRTREVLILQNMSEEADQYIQENKAEREAKKNS
jgi:uncharacterized protein YjiS (DUF1127 family)